MKYGNSKVMVLANGKYDAYFIAHETLQILCFKYNGKCINIDDNNSTISYEWMNAYIYSHRYL